MKGVCVFVVGEHACELAQSLTALFEPAPILLWQQRLQYLCAGWAFDQVERAIRRQKFTLMYGDFWRLYRPEITARFPDAKWVCNHDDVRIMLDGCSELTQDLPGGITPCLCARAMVDVHCDFMAAFAAESKAAFMQADPSSDCALYVDSHVSTSDNSSKRHAIAWVIEPYSYQGSIKIPDGMLLYAHGACGVPPGGGWIPKTDYMANYVKTAAAGIILSNKSFMQGHALRHAVVAATRTRGDVHAFGAGVGRPIKRKTDGIAPFMYAIVIENCIEDSYWTEKLVDSLLLKCVVFYWGAPNVHTWFLPESVIPFADIAELMLCLNTMSAEDYSKRQKTVELNYFRAQAWTNADDGVLLETDFLSTAPFNVSACSGLCAL